MVKAIIFRYSPAPAPFTADTVILYGMYGAVRQHNNMHIQIISLMIYYRGTMPGDDHLAPSGYTALHPE